MSDRKSVDVLWDFVKRLADLPPFSGGGRLFVPEGVEPVGHGVGIGKELSEADIGAKARSVLEESKAHAKLEAADDKLSPLDEMAVVCMGYVLAEARQDAIDEVGPLCGPPVPGDRSVTWNDVYAKRAYDHAEALMKERRSRRRSKRNKGDGQ